MKRKLSRVNSVLMAYYYKDGVKMNGFHSDISGDVSGLSGNASGLRGDVTYLRGDVTYLRGDVTGLSGDLDECEITDSEREIGVLISDLVATGE